VIEIPPIVTIVLTLYGVTAGVFLISENRRPQGTLAWLLVFIFLPVLGVLIYVLFGRSRKAFAEQSRLMRHDLDANASPLLGPIRSRQDADIARLEDGSHLRRKLMMLVRRNSQSMLTCGNAVEILQDATAFYPCMLEDMARARHSIHLQYFIWGADAFTAELKEILAERVRAGVEVRVLYDPLGSQAHLTRAYRREMQAAGIRFEATAPLWRLHTIS
jgi:cardiolipin synthase